MRGWLAVLSVVMLGCGGGEMPSAMSSAVLPGASMIAPATAGSPLTGGPADMSPDRVAHIVAAIDDLALLTDITGEDLDADFAAWFNTEAEWVAAEMDAGMVGDPTIATYVATVGSGQQKVKDGSYVMPDGRYEFGDEITTIVALRDRIAAMADQP
jgi:hypothetical protein